MKALGRVLFLFVMTALVIGCSTKGQVQSSSDTQLSSYYQAMHDQVLRNNPEMDHVLTFCKEMKKIAIQFEQHSITRQQFASKQEEMRALLRQEDEYRRQSAWNHQTGVEGPLKQYLQATYSGEEKPVKGVSAEAPEMVRSDASAVK